jgi:hypothetical protein
MKNFYGCSRKNVGTRETTFATFRASALSARIFYFSGIVSWIVAEARNDGIGLVEINYRKASP